MGMERDAEQLPHLTVEVADSGLGPGEDADLDVALSREPFGEDAQRDRLAGAGSAGDEGEAALAGELLDPPAERFDARGHAQRLDRHVGGERIPLDMRP